MIPKQLSQLSNLNFREKDSNLGETISRDFEGGSIFNGVDKSPFRCGIDDNNIAELSPNSYYSRKNPSLGGTIGKGFKNRIMNDSNSKMNAFNNTAHKITNIDSNNKNKVKHLHYTHQNQQQANLNSNNNDFPLAGNYFRCSSNLGDKLSIKSTDNPNIKQLKYQGEKYINSAYNNLQGKQACKGNGGGTIDLSNGYFGGAGGSIKDLSSPHCNNNLPTRLIQNGDIDPNSSLSKKFLSSRKDHKLQQQQNNMPVQKLQERYQNILISLKNGTNDVADFTGAELCDSKLKILLTYLRPLKTLRSLKLSKNKITDTGLQYMLTELEGMSIRTMHLSQNLLTEKSQKILYEFIKGGRFQGQSVSLSANNFLPSSKYCKSKIAEIKQLGVVVTI